LRNQELGNLRLDMEDKTNEDIQMKTELDEKTREISRMDEELRDTRDAIETSCLELDRREENIRQLSTELENKQTDMEQIKQQFLDKCDETMLLQTELNNMHREMQSRDRELDSQLREIEDTTSREVRDSKSALNWFKAELEKKQKETELEGAPGETWKEKLKIYDEIGKCLDVSEDKLKTKKISDEEPK